MTFLSYFKPPSGDASKPQRDSMAESSGKRSSTTPSTTNSEFHSWRSPSAMNSLNDTWAKSASLSDKRPHSELSDLNEIKGEVMVNWLYQQQMARFWTTGGSDQGVVLKQSRDTFLCCPADMSSEPDGFFKAIQELNVSVAMTVNTRVIRLFLRNNQHPNVPLGDGLRLQILPDVSYLPRCQRHHFAAFIADRGLLAVWDDAPQRLLDRAEKIENTLVQMIWQSQPEYVDDEKKHASVTISEIPPGDSSEDVADVEPGTLEPTRPLMMWLPIQSMFTLMLTTAAIGIGVSKLAREIYIDGNYSRLVLLVVIPFQAWFAFFFFQAVVGNAAQIFGPVAQLKENTKFYSGVRPRRLRRQAGPLPHVTIQMPVFKEGLEAVIEPTVRSMKAAISTYEMQGGTANIFINDDGMQVIPEEDAFARQDFYDEHHIGWVARPKHSPKPEGEESQFLRRGKFKKASNLNYGLWISARIEDKLVDVERSSLWTQEDEAESYRNALADLVEEEAGRTWADGNIRVGDYILLVDCDTRVPTDCFLDAVSEMEQSPAVAVLQYSSGVVNVTDSFFERGITFFTNLVYTAIKYAVANGDVAPFVGHNAFLRWSALQTIAYRCPYDQNEKYWSEDTVSEDFDMALRLQTIGYQVRMGAYTGDGFKEGVSLTVYDELARWEKYAYGCSELLFRPLIYWPVRGPFTKPFRRFIASRMPLPSKLTIMAYVGTYFALASSWMLTLANYFLTGWLNGFLDHYYLNSFQIYFSIFLVFSGLGNVALAVLRYRAGEKGLFAALWENFSWIPLLFIFLGGLSLHLSQAILSHLCGVEMTWNATSKEAEDTTFFQEIPKVFRKFKVTFVFCFVCTAMMVVLATAAPPLWRIDLFIAVFPLSSLVVTHFLLPIVLNPGLMRFTW